MGAPWNKDDEKENKWRYEAKDFGIRNWHTLNFDNLKAEVRKARRRKPKSNIPNIGFGQLLDMLEAYAVEHLKDCFEALDTLSQPSNVKFIEFCDEFLLAPNLADETLSETIYGIWIKVDSLCSKERFESLLNAFCALYGAKGWHIRDGKLIKGDKPAFKVQYHTDMWRSVDNSLNKQEQHVVFSLLLGGISGK